MNDIVFRIIALIAFVIICFTIVGVRSLETATGQCAQRQGTMVKTLDGWRCVELKEIK